MISTHIASRISKLNRLIAASFGFGDFTDPIEITAPHPFKYSYATQALYINDAKLGYHLGD